MRIYNRNAFLQLPVGTLYAKGKQWWFGGLRIKGETTGTGNDWWYRSLDWIASYNTEEAIERLEKMLCDGASFPVDQDETRDGGSLEDNDLFLVYELADLRDLMEVVSKAILLCEIG